jgi:hypothetical protein
MPVPSPLVARELTPDPVAAAPTGFALVDEALVDGLPHRIQLGGGLVAVLAVPTGLAVQWRDADPLTPVTSSAGGSTPAAAGPAGRSGQPPARLLVLRGDDVAGSVPLVAGRRALVGNDGEPPGAQLEVIVLAWDIRAGTLLGPGVAGARITLAWRRTDRAPDAFTAPPAHPRVRDREPAFAGAASGTSPTGGPR